VLLRDKWTLYVAQYSNNKKKASRRCYWHSAVSMSGFWVVTQWRLVGKYQRFEWHTASIFSAQKIDGFSQTRNDFKHDSHVTTSLLITTRKSFKFLNHWGIMLGLVLHFHSRYIQILHHQELNTGAMSKPNTDPYHTRGVRWSGRASSEDRGPSHVAFRFSHAGIPSYCRSSEAHGLSALPCTKFI
jgi:hypothetical protein